jgi:hypothetical protein
MNAFNPLAADQRLEASGLPRKQAEAIAGEITDGTSEFVTKDMLEATLDKQTIRMTISNAGMLTLACTILGTLIAALLR